MAGKAKKSSNLRNKKQCTENQKSELSVGVCTRSMTRMNINKLNDDCLLEIFSYLTKNQLIGIERVCKKWKELAFSIWAKETILNFEIITNITKNHRRLNMELLEKILIRCGEHVKTFDLDCPDTEDSWIHKSCNPDTIICLLDKYCTNLENLSLHCGNLTEKGLSKLEEKIIKNLKSLDIIRCGTLNDETLERFLEKGPNLNGIIMDADFKKTAGDTLANSGRHFKKFGVNINILNVEKILKSSPELEVLHAPKDCRLKALCLFPFREHLVELIIQCGKFFLDFPESPLPFPNLRLLDLNCDQSVSNDILSVFHKWFPNLESLDLTWCDYHCGTDKKLNNDGIKELSKLPKLKSVILSCLPFLKAESLLNLVTSTNGRLEKLGCYYCNKLRDPDMIKVVSLCPKLTFLDVSVCQRITEHFLDGVLELLPSRTCKKPLRIRITFSNYCHTTKYREINPMLEIEDFGELDEAHFDYETEDEYNEDYFIDDEDVAYF